MKDQRLLLLVSTLVLAGASSLPAADIKLIVNQDAPVSAVSADELKSVFLIGRTSLSDGSHAEPVLEKDGAAHEFFVKTYLGKSSSALQTYYRTLVFTGKGSMPKSFGKDAEVVAYVAKTKGAIGYVSADADTAGVKVLDLK
jgi:ABC-type phosphate transport system substrate-binding protein